MSEDTVGEETPLELHMFDPGTARALKKADVFATELKLVVKVYGEAQRLQGVVAKLTREEVALTAKLVVDAEQHVTTLQQLDSVNGQLANNEWLLDEARKGAQARIAEELDKWREQQLQARRQEIDGLMAGKVEENRIAGDALLEHKREIREAVAEQLRLQATIEILKQTRLDLVGEIAAVG